MPEGYRGTGTVGGPGPDSSTRRHHDHRYPDETRSRVTTATLGPLKPARSSRKTLHDADGSARRRSRQAGGRALHGRQIGSIDKMIQNVGTLIDAIFRNQAPKPAMASEESHEEERAEARVRAHLLKYTCRVILICISLARRVRDEDREILAEKRQNMYDAQRGAEEKRIQLARIRPSRKPERTDGGSLGVEIAGNRSEHAGELRARLTIYRHRTRRSREGAMMGEAQARLREQVALSALRARLVETKGLGEKNVRITRTDGIGREGDGRAARPMILLNCSKTA